jgi:membrane carboxypeptidase/penicillin-binding protein PbpC
VTARFYPATFTYTGATVTNAANSGTVVITFPATEGASTGISVGFTGPAGNGIILDGGFKLSKSDSNYSSITISVENTGSYDAFRWLVDGGNLAGETGGSVTLEASNYGAGAYWLTVIAEKAGVPYSREFSFTVVD